MKRLNLGILAHVDAGKTSLSERLLHATGVIDEVGRVDDGSTRTDTLTLERRRGITIKSAVVSFVVGDVAVNLIDTPGHPDFVAEVERVLDVLDGAVLVVSGVEGVQPQTLVLWRALRRLGVPTLIFVNKIDRAGAEPERVLRGIAAKLSRAIAPMGEAGSPGTRRAHFAPYGWTDTAFTTGLLDLLSQQDEELLAAYVDDETAVTCGRLREGLAAQTARGSVYPVFFGSAVTGAGVDSLIAGITRFLPCVEHDPEGPVSGRVFKVERGPTGQKVAYVRLFSGTVRPRDRVRFGGIDTGGECKVTDVGVLDRAADFRHGPFTAGQIGKLWGLSRVRVGDHIGAPPEPPATRRHFAPPTLETVVVARNASRPAALHLALTRLAEQDPLINLREDGPRGEMSLSLYGEVQKEVIQATLAEEFGVEVSFRTSTTICVERPVGVAGPSKRSEKTPTRFSAPSGFGSSPRLPAPACDSGWRSNSARCRPPSSGRWRRRSVRPCARGSTAGRSSTARW